MSTQLSGAPSPWFELRHASTERPVFVVVPERRMLVIEGAGPRHADDFRLATSVLRKVAELAANSLPRMQRSQPARRVVEIMWPIDHWSTGEELLEALDTPYQAWRQLVELPVSLTDAAAERAIEAVRRDGGRTVALVRIVTVTEGSSAQMLRTGSCSFADSVRTLLRLVLEAGARPVGDLHELVLADAAHVGQERARSILRVPVGSP